MSSKRKRTHDHIELAATGGTAGEDEEDVQLVPLVARDGADNDGEIQQVLQPRLQQTAACKRRRTSVSSGEDGKKKVSGGVVMGSGSKIKSGSGEEDEEDADSGDGGNNNKDKMVVRPASDKRRRQFKPHRPLHVAHTAHEQFISVEGDELRLLAQEGEPLSPSQQQQQQQQYQQQPRPSSTSTSSSSSASCSSSSSPSYPLLSSTTTTSTTTTTTITAVTGDDGSLEQRPAKKAKASCSAGQAGPISPMRAFADAEAAASAAAAVLCSPLGSFVVLPVEIILLLLSFLSGKGVCHVRLTSSEFNRLGKDQALWKAICLREFAPVPNRLFQEPFRKSWEWLYRSKAVIHTTKDTIKDGAVCCYQTKECRYEGEWKEKELDGYGIELWADGEEYEGWSTQGRLNGYGRASYTSGDTYIGMWKNGLRDGGSYVWSDGWRYEGEYQDGKLTGRGTLIFKNGSKFTGCWLDGERHGQGTMLYFDGSRYEGEWKHDKREGRGILYWPVTASSSSSSSSSPTSAGLAPPPSTTAMPTHLAPFGPASVPGSSMPPRLASTALAAHVADASKPQEPVRYMRYEGFWRDDQILEGGKVMWDDGTELSLEEALKRLK